MTRRTTPHAGYLLMSPSGYMVSLTKRVNNAARFPYLKDAVEVAKALTGHGANGRWQVVESPEFVGDPGDRYPDGKPAVGEF
jgi:hypothetical protein